MKRIGTIKLNRVLGIKMKAKSSKKESNLAFIKKYGILLKLYTAVISYHEIIFFCNEEN